MKNPSTLHVKTGKKKALISNKKFPNLFKKKNANLPNSNIQFSVKFTKWGTLRQKQVKGTKLSKL